MDGQTDGQVAVANTRSTHSVMRVKTETRMVQLPATAAIEYVTACWVSGAGGGFLSRGAFVRGVFCLGGFLSGVLLSGGLLPGGLLSGGLMPVLPSSMRIRTI